MAGSAVLLAILNSSSDDTKVSGLLTYSGLGLTSIILRHIAVGNVGEAGRELDKIAKSSEKDWRGGLEPQCH